MDCSPPGSSVHGIFQARVLEWIAIIFSGENLPNPGLPHYRQILYHLSHQRSPRILEWVAIPSPGNLPDPGIELGSPALQANSLPAESPGKPLLQWVLNKCYNVNQYFITLPLARKYNSFYFFPRYDHLEKTKFHTSGHIYNFW